MDSLNFSSQTKPIFINATSIIIIIIIGRIKLKESEKKDKYLDLARELKKTMEHEGNDYTDRDWCIQ